MNDYAEIVVLAEGLTEKIFIQDIISPYLAGKGIYITPIIISKPGQKGGDVRFARVKNDIGLHLKQRHDTYLTLFVDYYGTRKDWPGLAEAEKQATSDGKAERVNSATKEEVSRLFGDHGSDRRFIPYIAMHEFEAMLFSDPQILSAHLGVSPSEIDRILSVCGSPEDIDDSPQTAPSKRLERLSKRFKKTSTGISVAKEIGLPRIRKHCPVFNKWLTEIECVKRGEG